jgi:hypothetical protein
MKKIKNNYIKKLAFIFDGEGGFTIESNEEKKVSDELANRLLQNPWISEVKEEKKIEVKPKEEIKEEPKTEEQSKEEIKKVGEINKNN